MNFESVLRIINFLRIFHSAYDSPFQRRSILLAVEWPVLVDVVPYVSMQYVGIITCVRNCS